jgi:hypothetical protein
VRKIVIIAGALWTLAVASCTVTAGTSSTGGDACEALSCQDALVSGLQVSGDSLCDSAADSAYQDVLNCACATNGGCTDACGDNLCNDLGESSACGDCLNANCPTEHSTCANN